MKKVLCICLPLFLFVSLFSFPVMAEDDLFYYDRSNAALEAMLPEMVGLQKTWDALDLRHQGIAKDDQNETISKLNYNLDEIYCDYNWNLETLQDFFAAEDKRAYLNSLPPNKYYYPVYYEGKLVESRYERIDYIEKDPLKYWPFGMEKESIDQTAVLFQNRERFQDYLNANGFSQYRPLLSIHYGFYWFGYLEQDGQEAVICLYHETTYPISWIEASPGDLMTVEEFLQIIEKYEQKREEADRVIAAKKPQKSPEETPEEEPPVTEPTPDTNDTEDTADTAPSQTVYEQHLPKEENSDLLFWIFLGAAVLLTGSVLTMILIRKK